MVSRNRATIFLSDITASTIIEGKELNVLLIASIQKVFRGNKKYGKGEVFKLVKDSLDDDRARETFEELLELLKSQIMRPEFENGCLMKHKSLEKSIKFKIK